VQRKRQREEAGTVGVRGQLDRNPSLRRREILGLRVVSRRIRRVDLASGRPVAIGGRADVRVVRVEGLVEVSESFVSSE
jgi:hypothetical protein